MLGTISNPIKSYFFESAYFLEKKVLNYSHILIMLSIMVSGIKKTDEICTDSNQ